MYTSEVLVNRIVKITICQRLNEESSPAQGKTNINNTAPSIPKKTMPYPGFHKTKQ